MEWFDTRLSMQNLKDDIQLNILANEERRDIWKKASAYFGKFLAGGDYDKEITEEFYGMMCEDIQRERKRIGGNWAIAFVAFSQELRDFIR